MTEPLEQEAIHASDIDLDDALDGEEDDHSSQPRPVWQWLLTGVAGLALFAGLVTAFAGLLEANVEHAPAKAVLMRVPGAKPSATQSAAAAEPKQAQAAAPAAPESVPAPAQAPAAAAPVRGPHIVLLMADAGLNVALTEKAIAGLPPEVAMGFSPYGDKLQALAAKARADGHEIWVGLPMEPLRYPAIDPGPHALLLSLPAEQNIKRVEWALGRVEGEAGVFTIMGSAFTADADALNPILKAISTRGLGFIDGRSTAKTKSRIVARQIGLPLLVNDRFVGDPATSVAIDRQLAELERLARKEGVAVGVIQPSAQVIDRLSRWLPGLRDRNVQLAPATAALAAQRRQAAQ